MKGKDPDRSLQCVKGVGPRIYPRLQKKGLNTIRDALYFFPRAYDDRRILHRICDLKEEGFYQIEGRIVASDEVRFSSGKRCFQVFIEDDTGVISLKWLNYNMRKWKLIYCKKKELNVYGYAKYFQGNLEFLHPDVTFLSPEEGKKLPFEGNIISVYPEVEGVHQKTLGKIIGRAVTGYADLIEDPLPEYVREEEGLPLLSQSIKAIHFPPPEGEAGGEGRSLNRYMNRVIFDEFFSLQLGIARKRFLAKGREGLPIPWEKEIVEEIKTRLPFTLTNDQKRSINEILRDLKKKEPMHRLLQGDVGSGKTILAWIASMIVWHRGYQVAVMAPTEILAEQHYENFKKLSHGLPVSIRLLTSSLSSGDKRQVKREAASHTAEIVVGTHALIQDDVTFKKLALAIVDEQHRFGVYQRLMLKGKGVHPHLLVMTATPIPRTLAMTLYGDLDISLIEEMPPGRSPVITRIIRKMERKACFESIRGELDEGGQAYFVYPVIEESEKLDLRGASKMYGTIRDNLFPEYSVELLHGRMKGEEKERIVENFREGRTQILVSTTFIEVGIDVPNANVLVVEHAERFGLSQLHQLRGRIGRGKRKSYCYLMTGTSLTEEARERLKVLSTTTDGFAVAEMDMKLRGPGDFIGTRQAGMPDLIFGNLLRDGELLRRAREMALRVIEKDPNLNEEVHRPLREFVQTRWKNRIDFAFV